MSNLVVVPNMTKLERYGTARCRDCDTWPAPFTLIYGFGLYCAPCYVARDNGG